MTNPQHQVNKPKFRIYTTREYFDELIIGLKATKKGDRFGRPRWLAMRLQQLERMPPNEGLAVIEAALAEPVRARRDGRNFRRFGRELLGLDGHQHRYHLRG